MTNKLIDTNVDDHAPVGGNRFIDVCGELTVRVTCQACSYTEQISSGNGVSFVQAPQCPQCRSDQITTTLFT